MHYKASHRNSNGTIAEPNFLPKGQKVRKKGAVKKSPTKSIREWKDFRMLFGYDGHIDALW